MTRKIASLLLGLLSVSQPVSAQADKPVSANSDRWVIYERVASDGKPLVVAARTGNSGAQRLLLDGLATVVICRTDPTNVTDQGMPQGTERLYSIEDKLDEEPALLAAAAVRVASVTGQSQRRMFFVHRDPINLSQVLELAQAQGFSCEQSKVDDRQAMIHLVTPFPLEIQLYGDQEVLANLQENGDDGHASRKTDFWFYGQRRLLLPLIANLKTQGFSVDHWLSSPTGVVLSREMPVDLAAFQALTPVLIGAAEQSGVDYDGWETFVVSQTSTQLGSRRDH